jgi:WD40-like Beta Propeller Repeat
MSLQKRTSRFPLITAGILGGACILATVTFIIRSDDSTTTNPQIESTQETIVDSLSAPQTEDKKSVVIQLDPVPVKPMKFLPDGVSLSDPNNQSALMSDNGIPIRKKPLKNIRPLTNKEQNGEFLSPRISPDGLQMIVTRPGYNGVYLLGANGGNPIFLCEGNAFTAKWTEDGRIEIQDGNGNTLVYGPDGTLESTSPTPSDSDLVFAENDTIFSRDSPGNAPIPLTGNDDQYYNPTASPNGDNLLYEGLHTGLYMSSADGSGDPVNLGPGNNPTWLDDGSGFVFDRTSDDGHHLVEGDLVYVPSDLSEQVILDDNGRISQMPSVDPDGNTIYFESDGIIYTATLN